MILGKFKKQPAEVLDYDVDFTEYLADGDTLLSSGNPPIPSPYNITVDGTGLVVESAFVINNGKTIKVWLTGGTNGVKYKITITATTNAGRVKQVEFVIQVKDE